MRRIAFSTALLSLALALPVEAAGQDLKYTTSTAMELGGAMGQVAAMMPGLGDPVLETTYIKGTRVRRDADESSTVLDWSSGDMLMLFHPPRTFARLNFVDMAESMAGAAAEAAEQAEDAEPAPEAAEEPSFEVRLSTDRTGRSEDIAGYEAEQVILTLELVPVDVPEDAEEDERPATLAVVSELWMSTDFPEYRMMQEMQAEAAERLRESGAGQKLGESVQGLTAFDPRLADAWEESLEQMRQIEGTALRSTLHFVTVPFGLELDRQRVLDRAGEGLGSGAADAAKEEAKEAVRGLLGRFGGGRQEEAEEPAPTQSVFMRITSEIGEIETGSLDDAIFGVPEGYTEQAAETPIGR